MAQYGPSQAQAGLGGLISGLAGGYAAQKGAQNQMAMQQAYADALFGRQALMNQGRQDVANTNLTGKEYTANHRPAPGAGKPTTFDVGTNRRIIGSGNYLNVVNKYNDLYNAVNSTQDPAQRQLLAQGAIAHGGWTAPINTWMADTPDQTPEERAAGQKINQLSQQAQQMGYGEQLRFMHAMETLNQQTGGMRPPNPAMVDHVYKTTPGLDAPPKQFATMMQGQIDSSVPWDGMVSLARTQGKDPSAIMAEKQSYMQKFHQIKGVPYDSNNQPQAPEFGYGQPAKNGVASLGNPAPVPVPSTSPAPSPTGLAPAIAPGTQAPLAPKPAATGGWSITPAQ